MTTLTDKELIKEIKERIGSLDVRDNIERRAYEIALASLEAEPVGDFYEYKPGDWYQRSVGDKAPKWVPLYATPPVPELQADVAQAIENLKQKLVECNRYNYCADAVKGVEDACRAVSYSQADNQPASGNQAAESNRGNEWTGNPDIDNAIIMLDRIDTLENCDDDRIEGVKAVLRRLAVNYPVTPDGWISCSERMPAQDDWILIYSKHGEYMAGQVQGEYVELSDGTLSWLGNALFWMLLPEPPQEAG
ncbi:DUF551 domain-containing protein [Escherichia coli]|nr:MULTISPECIES: DUF551 domain-containing protein [Escherichia]EOV48539.1 hypothetical protein A1SC_01964 [Escherichia sp. KTE52]MCZ4167620.1 DUF551 domain-containing protein [Escherichia coli]